MPEIQITVRNKIPILTGDVREIVTDNTDYTVRFLFDEEWGEGEKVVYFVRSGGYVYPPVLMDGESVTIPEQKNAGMRSRLLIGVQQGDIRTTTACELPINASVKEKIDEDAVEPEPSFWELIEEKILAIIAAEKSAKESAEGAAESKVSAEAAAATAGESARSAAVSASSALNSASAAEKSAERAEQVAVANGYAEFYMKNGRIYLVRTENIVDKVDFELKEGRMVVKISG
jgi:hypothetical protein